LSAWHQRPWPTFVGWSLSVPIMCSGERRVWNGSEHVWEPLPEVSISLTRAMLQQVAAQLGVTEQVVMDGDDIRWFQPGADGAFHNVLWVDRFYRQDGSLIDDAVMREAFRSVIAANAGTWPNYRNLVVHAGVRLGSFLDNGGHEVGEYLLGTSGEMLEVSSLNDLSAVSTRFLYRIRPDYR
jgi:hypothetical protein